MKTEFSAERLADPDARSAEPILRSCVHCGFCTATCPTYVLLGDERDSPRGRIYLIKTMLESGAPPTAELVKHVDRCLSCLSCMTTCPSGVNYMHLIDLARARIERSFPRSLADRAIRAALAFVLTRRGWTRAGLRAARLMRPLASRWRRPARLNPGLSDRLAAMISLASHDLAAAPVPATAPPPDVATIAGRRGRVALLRGCVQDAVAPHINAAATRLLARHGIEVVQAEGETCCGALSHHLGREREGLARARANIDAWLAEADSAGLDAILVTTSGCGTVIKDYGHMLRDDPLYAEKARRVARMTRDISEYALTLGVEAATRSGLVVAYHAACSLQHGQKVTRAPKELLSNCGFVVKDVPEGHLCCGSAGTYNLLQPHLAGRLRERKVRNIAGTAPDVIAAGNIGCMMQIAGGLSDEGHGIPVVHVVELLDWADGGPPPAALATRH